MFDHPGTQKNNRWIKTRDPNDIFLFKISTKSTKEGEIIKYVPFIMIICINCLYI